MSDLIERQAAYDTLTGYYHHTTEIQHKALREALERVPSAQPEKRTEERAETHSCDCISRQAAISVIAKWMLEYGGEGEERERNALKQAAEEIKDLPSTQPQQRWMPCSKELPERNLVVLVTTRWGEVTEGVKLTGNAWFIGRGEENAFDSDIIAWMPKPEPYKEGGAV